VIHSTVSLYKKLIIALLNGIHPFSLFAGIVFSFELFEFPAESVMVDLKLFGAGGVFEVSRNRQLGLGIGNGDFGFGDPQFEFRHGQRAEWTQVGVVLAGGFALGRGFGGG
jgi:hypothetical protein